jgi:transcriptional regulator with XRE-family HTH domain
LVFEAHKLVVFSMIKRSPPVFPRTKRQLDELGARLRAARLRRMTQATLAARADISLPTIRKLEKGGPTTSLATLTRALQVLGLNGDLDLIAGNDELGRKLQDIHQVGPPRSGRAS